MKHINFNGSQNSQHIVSPEHITRIGIVEKSPANTYISFTDGTLLEVTEPIEKVLLKMYVNNIPRKNKVKKHK